jgi:hypothetical protein
MNDLDRYLTHQFASTFDKYRDHVQSMDTQSIDDIKRLAPLTLELMITQWAAELEVKSHHELMKGSISGIK